MYHGEILGYIIGANQRFHSANMKNFGSVYYTYGTILHPARIARTGTVYSYRIKPYFGYRRIVTYSVNFRSAQRTFAIGMTEYRLY